MSLEEQLGEGILSYFEDNPDILDEISAYQSGKPTKNSKATKAEANYRHSTGRKRCKNCVNMLPQSRCELVSGNIRPNDVCDYWSGESDDRGDEESD